MYPISPTFQRILETRIGRNRYVSWWGTITLTTGTTYNFNADHISQGTGSLSSVCELPVVGGAYSTEFQAQFYLPINPRSLKGACIELSVRITCATATNTWSEAESFFWSEIQSTSWDQQPRMIYTDIPMGRFIVSEAKRAINSVKINANDFMVKFDKALPHMDTTARTPFDWLRMLCTTCGVELGMTNAVIRTLPNGSRSFTYADVNTNIKTCRDAINHLAAVLGSIAVIDRYGKLIFVRYSASSVAEITPDDRFSSTFSDMQYGYTGMIAHYKAKSLQEYFRNVRTLEDNGLVIELGTNCFLQIANDSNRAAAAQTIIDVFRNVKFTAFDVSMPFNPSFDLLDTLTFSGGHAPTNCVGPITSIIRKFGGAMTVKCETPSEDDNPTRETTQSESSGSGISGSGTSYANSGFWLLIDAGPDDVTAVSAETLTNELTVDCTIENTCTQITWTGAYSLDEDATITIKVLVDEEVIYQVSDDQKAGNHVLNVTTGYDIQNTGEHVIQVLISESAITPGSGSGSGSGGGSSGGDVEIISEPVDPTVGEQGEIELPGDGNGDDDEIISNPVDDPVEEAGEHELTP